MGVSRRQLEHEEVLQECITRELREGLGVESLAGEILTTPYTYPGGTVELIALAVKLKSNQFYGYMTCLNGGSL